MSNLRNRWILLLNSAPWSKIALRIQIRIQNCTQIRIFSEPLRKMTMNDPGPYIYVWYMNIIFVNFVYICRSKWQTTATAMIGDSDSHRPCTCRQKTIHDSCMWWSSTGNLYTCIETATAGSADVHILGMWWLVFVQSVETHAPCVVQPGPR